MVLNVGKLKDGDYHYVHKDISHVCKAAHGARDHKRVVKVILETCLLTREEIIDACILSVSRETLVENTAKLQNIRTKISPGPLNRNQGKRRSNSKKVHYSLTE